MSSDPDRIAVPTNGRRPHAVTTPTPEPEPAAEAPSPESTAAGVPSHAELATALSPKQLAVGFGIVASIVLLVAGRVLRRRSRG
jgi:hypothetical protein